MKYCLQLLFTLFFVSTVAAQTHYTGVIGQYPIELVLTDYSAIYMYKKTNTPISLSFELKNNVLTLYEKVKTKNTASLVFKNFDSKQEELNGVWTALTKRHNLNIKLNRDTEVKNSPQLTNKSVLQAASLPDKYFLTQLSMNTENDAPIVTGLKIIDKKTDKVLQTITDLECRNIDINNVSVGDYNFDGFPDFSILEQSYVGANTSSLYFLYDPKSKEYYDSGFSGMSLSFDQAKKRITETNQCCAGTAYTETIYKLVNNDMIKVATNSYKWNNRRKTYLKIK